MVIHEIEQKFGILTQLLPRFRSNRGSPPFQHLHFLRTEHFEDAYYDSCDKLSSNGLWVRRRAAEWEAKHRKSGDFTRTTFHETNDVSEIQSWERILGVSTRAQCALQRVYGANACPLMRSCIVLSLNARFQPPAA